MLVVNNLPPNAGEARAPLPSLDREDPLEEGMASHSSVLARRIPWAEESGGLQSMGSQGHDLRDSVHTCVGDRMALE